MSMKMKFGSKDIPFVYKGDKLIYPNPIKDGLLLWYDFKGMRNTDTNKEIAKDLSENGNDGTLTNFNFTEESGYKDNTLVFDGVDDSLTIPELELDETAMTVVQDGKLYAYEDDKVLTVGEGGEVVGSGKNLVYNTSFSSTEGWRTITSKILGVNNHGITLEVFEGVAWNALMSTEDNSVYIEKGVPYTITYEVNLESPLNSPHNLLGFSNYGIPDKAGYVLSKDVKNQLDDSKLNEWQTITTTLTPEVSGEYTLYIRFGNPDRDAILKVRNVMVEKNSIGNRRTPSPKDFIITEYTPPYMRNLQIYNKPLRKDELLHNAESKGLKKLKPGVVVQDGLVLHYDFSHESNTSEYKDKAFDYSGNGNHGALQNFNFTEESGYDGNKLLFDGVDDRIETIPMSNFNGALTLTTTLDIRDLSDNFVGYAMTNTDSNGARLWLSKNGQAIRIQIYDARESRFVSSTVSKGKQSITITFDGSLIVLYKNGLAVSQYESETLFTNWTTNNLFIGSYDNGGTYVPPKINQKSFMMYDKALTPEEIAHNYAIEKEKFNII